MKAYGMPLGVHRADYAPQSKHTGGSPRARRTKRRDRRVQKKAARLVGKAECREGAI